MAGVLLRICCISKTKYIFNAENMKCISAASSLVAQGAKFIWTA
jgi:hypothetical protein